MTTILVPTYNEAPNIPELVRRIRNVLPKADILVVDDDSPDGTFKVAIEHGCRAVLRKSNKGLSASVIDGFKVAGDPIIVMDADLQHPPELLPLMEEALETHEFVCASRYCKGGGTKGWSLFRRAVSRVANYMAFLVAPKVSDRTTGFFGLRRSIINPTSLDARGWKIGLEVAARGHYTKAAEVPYVFEPRRLGESKLSRSQYIDYIGQLISLHLFKFRWIKFSLVGCSGLVVSLGLLYLLTETAGLPYIVSAVVSSFLAITNNYTWNYLWTFKDKSVGLLRGWVGYLVMAGTTSLIYLGLLALLAEIAGLWYMFAAVIAILITFVMRYFISNRYIWKEHKCETS